ncbi:MAG: hypothetical protein K2Z80_22875 [Xanthobacteraceae bacterium]|nr:hypothetical protein [Xanthobacteraceae bacterium]
MEFVETQDGWHLSFKEGRVDLLQIDFRLTVLISDGRNKASFCVETQFELKCENSEAVLVPEQTQTLAPILSIFNAAVHDISITRTGTLVVQFEKGAVLYVASNESYEAWQLTCSFESEETNLMLVCPPGGDVAVFRESANPRRAKTMPLN